MNEAVLLLGSNIHPERNLRRALKLLANLTEITARSRVYKTKAVGNEGPDFLNQAVMLTTGLSEDKIKINIINPVEATLKRVRTENKYAPRTIDLDLIILNGKVLDPNLWKYRFIALPVADLLPDLRHPETQKPLREIASVLD